MILCCVCSKDRDAYRSLLRAKVRGSGIDLYAYGLTSNHVHILLRSIDGEQIARLVKSVAEFGSTLCDILAAVFALQNRL